MTKSILSAAVGTYLKHTYDRRQLYYPGKYQVVFTTYTYRESTVGTFFGVWL